MGTKPLYVNNAFGLLKEIHPLCLYDFFVFPRHWGVGIAKGLLESIFQMEGQTPNKLAIESASEDMLEFMEHNYNLKNVIAPPVSGYTIYKDFFEEEKNQF